MKKIVLLAFFIGLTACKEKAKSEENLPQETEQEDSVQKFPEALDKVFGAHGGLDTWRNQRTLTYDLPKPELTETHVIDLFSRKDKITSEGYTMGYDGEDVWLLDVDESYKGDPVFYHNLMFYFYAMPFVLADDGINYSTAENLDYEGISYPGIRITYDNGVGTSPKDEYYLHYHPETHQMQWLGYTVTYRSGETSDNIKWIRYNDWMNVNGLTLPKSIIWYDYEGRTIKEEKSLVMFENVRISSEAKNDDFFQKPDEAIIVVKE
ncbi:DUF6503 family protein [Maribacter aestuarii]|uniref:DUF6503 family protein n=1 Tax=Maribacter aestuarii TaxID=1130723 RepID=UPI00248C0F5B|nr:DUF6503 family protein [Maribacter aestuarii]